MEKTVVLIKPDGVRRGLIGEIVGRFEKVGLQMIACKMVDVPEELATQHYGYEEGWFQNVGEKLIEFYGEHGQDPEEEIGTKEPVEIGKKIQHWNVNYLTEGPVLAMIWQGDNAVSVVRKIVGATFPNNSAPGTIRGDYSFDSPDSANSEGRSVRNLIHASGAPEEAQFERELWFKEKEIID